MNGYNALVGAKVKLGSWDEYLAMRDGALRINKDYRDLLSNDLGAIGGFLFDVDATSRLHAPTMPRSSTHGAPILARVRDETKKRRRQAQRRATATAHTP